MLLKTSNIIIALFLFSFVLGLPFSSYGPFDLAQVFAQSPLPSSGQASLTSSDKTYQKIQERIKKTKERIQYLYRYASWNDDRTSEYYGKTSLIFNRMLSIGEICANNRDEQKLKECDSQTKKLYDAAKSAYRLTKYFAILSGKPHTCVQANLGTKPIREGTPVEPDKTNFGNKAQSLFLCSGDESSAQNLDLRWRVEAKDGGMIKVKENFRTDPEFMQNIDNERAAEKMISEILEETK